MTNGESDSISVIDTASDAVIATIPVGDKPSGLAVTPDGGSLYVMTASGVVEVVDTTLQTVVATISVGSSGDIAITPDGARAYVAAGLVYVIDTATNAVVNALRGRNGVRPRRVEHGIVGRHRAGRDAGLHRRLHLQHR